MMQTLSFIVPGLAAAVISYLLTPLMARLAARVGAVDMPGERKVHTTPVPRLGGLAVVAAIAMTFAGGQWLSAGAWQLPPHLVTGMGLGLLPILVVSIADDIYSVPARWKFAVHTLGAAIALSFGVSLSPVVHLFGSPLHIGWLAAPLSVAWIVGVTNAFNIIDGLDGLSSGLAFISAICMSAVFAVVGQPEMAGVSLVLGGALAGFLPYNLHPARSFLGDTGATAIGFSLAAFALRGGSTLSTGFAALLPVFILGLPIADTLVAMLRRTLRRVEHRRGGVFEADRNHIHHRLLALGIDHAQAVVLLYAAGLILAAAALLSVFATTREAAFMVVGLLLAGIVGIQRLGYDEFAFIRRGTVLRLYEIPTVKRGFFVVFVDLAVAVVAAYLSVGLKADVWSPGAVGGSVLEIGTTMAPIIVIVFSWRRMYKGSWRVAGLHDLTKAAVAVFIATPLGALFLRTFSSRPYTLSLFVIYALVTLLITVAIRASYVILENSKLRSSNAGVPILIYGAGRRGAAAVQELFQNRAAPFRPVGFLDDDPEKSGRIVNGIPVLGRGKDLDHLLTAAGARGVLLSTHKINNARTERTTEICRARSANAFTLDVSLRHLDGTPFVSIEEIAHPKFRAAMDPFEDFVHMEAGMGCAPCPSCNSSSTFRSKSRTTFERFRKVRTHKRLFKCERCGWRGWLIPLVFSAPETLGAVSTPDLQSVDDSIAANGPALVVGFDPAHLK